MPAPTLLEARPELAALVSPNSPVSAAEVRTTESTIIILKCQTCGKDRPVKASSVASKKASPNCLPCAIKTQQRNRGPRHPISETAPEFAALFADSSPVKPTDVSVTSDAVAVFVCQKCGKEHDGAISSVYTRRENTLCPGCKSYPNDRKQERVKPGRLSVADRYPHLVPLLSKENELAADEMATYMATRVLVDCPECGDTRSVRLHNASHSTWSGLCSSCSARHRTMAARPLAETHPAVAARFAETSPVRPEDVTAQSSLRALFVCSHCNRAFESKVANQTRPRARGVCSDCRWESKESAA